MALHLTCDNHRAAALGDKANHLAAVSKDGGTHLVCIRQTAAWTDRALLAPPDAARWCACMGTGVEVYPAMQGGTLVYSDTQQLVSAVASACGSLAWRSGHHPCYNFFTRGAMKGPYSKRTTLPANSSEFGHAMVAYRFNLHRLHLSRMTSFTASLRVYAPSLAFQVDPSADGIYRATLVNGGLYEGASSLRARISTDLPDPSADVAEGFDAWEFAGNCNGGASVTKDTNYSYHSLAYNPYHGDDLGSLPVWTPNERKPGVGPIPPSAAPQLYHHDFAFTNAANLAVLAANPARVWVTAHFHVGNGFARNVTGNYGLDPARSAMVWFYRADLVLSCTGPAMK